MIDNYAIDQGHDHLYDPVLQTLGVEPFWFPSGQAAITKL
jgi:hypothetical protein